MRRRLALAALAVVALAGCGRPDPLVRVPKVAGMVTADDIPVARTPPGGYGQSLPAPVLKTCTEPLAKGAPDFRGLWKVVVAERGGKPAPKGDRIWNYVERIEQCGDRVIDMGGGTIADARADGTARNGVHDVSAFDYTRPIHVRASFEDGVFVLRPMPIPHVPLTVPGLKVTRRLDESGYMVWTRPDRGGLRVLLKRIGGPNDPYTRLDARRPALISRARPKSPGSR